MPELILMRTAFRDQLAPKRALTAIVFALLPAAVALLWRAKGTADTWTPEAGYNSLSASIVFGFILVLLAAIFATGAVSRDMEQKTIAYLLTRPVPRWRVLLARFVPGIVVTMATAWIAATALAFAAFGADAPAQAVYRRDLLILPLGCAAYGALFLLLATSLQRPLLWGLLYTFGWESWVPNLPGSFRKASLMSYLRVLSPHPAPEGELKDISELLSLLAPTTISSRLAWMVLMFVIVASLIGAIAVFSAREYVPRDDVE